MRGSIYGAAVVLLASAGGFAACSSSSDGAPADQGSAGSGGDDDASADAVADQHGEVVAPDAGACDADAGPTPVACSSYDAGTAPATDDLVLGVNFIYVDRDRSRNLDPNAWQSYGFDLDGKTSTPASTDHCQLVSGANASVVMQDGPGGVDNGFAATIAPIIAAFDNPKIPSWVDKWTESVRGGGPTIVLRFPSLPAPAALDAGAPDAAAADADVDAADAGYAPPPLPDAGALSDAGTPTTLPMLGYASARLCAGQDTSWDGPHLLPIETASIACGDLARPFFYAPSGQLTGDYWFSGQLDEAWITVPIKDALLPVHLKKVKIEAFLSADRRLATLGKIGGIANMDELINALFSVRGYLSTLACSDLVFPSYESQIRAGADIMDDGSQDPAETCNGISVGLGFDAAQVRIGALAATPPAGDPCNPDGG